MSEEIIEGNNAPEADTPIEIPKDVQLPEQVETRDARLAKGEQKLAQLKALLDAERGVTADNPPITEKPANPVEEKAPVTENKAEEVPEQFKTPDGKLDEKKLEKSKQNLEQLVQKKRVDLEEYKRLQRELSQVDREIAEVKKEKQLPNQQSNKGAEPEVELPGSLDEQKSKILALLEKDPAEALIYTQLLAERRIKEMLAAERAREAEEAKQASWLKRLDDHAKDNPWVYDEEGMAAIKEVLQKRPYLYKGEDPYGDALAFVDKSKFARGQATGSQAAQSVGAKTPILGAGKAVPPPASEAVSDEVKLKQLKAQYMAYKNNPKEASRIEQQMDEIVKRTLFRKK